MKYSAIIVKGETYVETCLKIWFERSDKLLERAFKNYVTESRDFSKVCVRSKALSEELKSRAFYLRKYYQEWLERKERLHHQQLQNTLDLICHECKIFPSSSPISMVKINDYIPDLKICPHCGSALKPIDGISVEHELFKLGLSFSNE